MESNYDYAHHEDEYFLHQDREARRALREKLAANAKAGGTAAAGASEADVLQRFRDLGITDAQAPALHLMPLVAVCWADGVVQKRERAAVFKAAKAHGIEPSSEAGRFLVTVLEEEPDPAFFDAVKSNLKALLAARGVQPNSLLESSRAVAASAGGFFGFSDSISDEEKQAIADLEATLGG